MRSSPPCTHMYATPGFLELRREHRMPQLAAYAEGIALPEELVGLLTDAFDEDG